MVTENLPKAGKLRNVGWAKRSVPTSAVPLNKNIIHVGTALRALAHPTLAKMATTRPRKIFLDANVVIRAGRPPGSPLITRVTDLVQAGYVKVVTTDLTKMEIAKKHAGDDFNVMRNLTKRRVRDLADEILGVKVPAISPAELHRKLLENYQASVEKMFKSLRAETLSIDSIKPSVVFDAYARKTGLFSDEAKKDQFPDAFIFETLRVIAKSSDPLTLVSDDKDFAAATKDAEHISRLRSIPDLFAELGLTIEAPPDFEDFVDNNLGDIVSTVNKELNQWGLEVSDVQDAEIEEATVENVSFIDFRTFRAANEGKDILVVGRIEMDVKVSYHHPDWDTATYDSEDKVLIPHHTVEGEKTIDVEAAFNMILTVDEHDKPTSIAEFSFDDDNFIWVSIGPNDYDHK
ncbi:MAG: PIN domain-containing protein [Rhodoplanes sp.]